MFQNMKVAPPKLNKKKAHRWKYKDREQADTCSHEDGEVIDKSVDHLHLYITILISGIC